MSTMSKHDEHDEHDQRNDNGKGKWTLSNNASLSASNESFSFEGMSATSGINK